MAGFGELSGIRHGTSRKVEVSESGFGRPLRYTHWREASEVGGSLVSIVALGQRGPTLAPGVACSSAVQTLGVPSGKSEENARRKG